MPVRLPLLLGGHENPSRERNFLRNREFRYEDDPRGTTLDDFVKGRRSDRSGSSRLEGGGDHGFLPIRAKLGSTGDSKHRAYASHRGPKYIEIQGGKMSEERQQGEERREAQQTSGESPGQAGQDGKNTCPECGGSGKIQEDVTCPNCGGTGKVEAIGY